MKWKWGFGTGAYNIVTEEDRNLPIMFSTIDSPLDSGALARLVSLTDKEWVEFVDVMNYVRRQIKSGAIQFTV